LLVTLPRPLVPVFVASCLALAAATAFAGPWGHDPASSLPLVKLPGDQVASGIVRDSGHGAIAFYLSPAPDPFGTPPPAVSLHSVHVLQDGTFDAAWSSATVPGITNIFGFNVLADGAGGAYVGWADERNTATTGRDVYLQHLHADGTPDPAWPVGGRAVCTAPGTQTVPWLVHDGGTGVILTWSDRRDSLTTGYDLYAGHVRANGTLDPAWPVNGVAIVKTTGNQTGAWPLPDGAGGAFVVWSDTRTPANGQDVYAGHLLAGGTMDPAWPANGRAVATLPGPQLSGYPVTDGAGGLFVTWYDYTQPASVVHVLANGTVDPTWPAGGPTLDPNMTVFGEERIAPDGATGVYVLWDAVTNTVANSELYARHLLADGTWDPAWPAFPVRLEPGTSNKTFTTSFELVPLGDGSVLFDWADDNGGAGEPTMSTARLLPTGVVDPAWPAGGVLISATGGYSPVVGGIADGRGGAIYSWSDVRDSLTTQLDVYVDRIGPDGRRGVTAPDWHAVRDVANDQGGRVSLQWYWSSLDNMPADPLTSYNVWRRLFASAVTPDVARRALPGSAAIAPQPGDVRVRGDGATATFWEFLASVPPRGMPDYAYTVNTLADSTSAGTAWETYEVDAVANATAYSSVPDSGYSVDNIPPPAPTSFAGAYAVGSATLQWDPLLVPDLASYRLYRGGSAAFVPSAANRIASPVTTHYTDAAGKPAYYKLTGLDVHGNEGPATTLLPAGTAGVDGATPAALSLALGSSSPAHGSATLALGLPRADRIALAVYDDAGRRVRTVFAGAAAAGRRVLAWDLRDDAGRPVGDGLYFVELMAGGERRTVRISVLR
jgi:hypothetical protein